MTTTPQQRLREIRDEASALAAKGLAMTPEDSTKFEEMMVESDGIKTQIANLDRFDNLKGWMDTSAGGLPLASTEAGEAVFQTDRARNGNTSIKMLEQYGPGIYNDKKFQATAQPEYRDALKAYIQFGERGLNSAQLKTLQEGQDTEGGSTRAPLAA